MAVGGGNGRNREYKRYVGHRKSNICATGIPEGKESELGQKQYLK